MESRLQDHERIRGGLFFIQSIPRDENWKVRRDILQAYEPKQPEDCTLNVSASLPDIKTPASSLSTPEVSSSPKLNRKVTEVTPLEKQANGAYVAAPEIHVEASASPRTKRAAVRKEKEEENKKVSAKTSMDCILEDSVSGGATAASGTRGGNRRGSRVPSRRGSAEAPEQSMPSVTLSNEEKNNMISYWLQVFVSPQVKS